MGKPWAPGLSCIIYTMQLVHAAFLPDVWTEDMLDECEE